MNFSKSKVFYFIGLALIMLLLCSIQSTLWPHWIGWGIAPQLWLTLVVYLSLYRRFNPAIIQIYAMGLILTFYSNIRLGVLWLVLFALHLGLVYARNRIFSPTLRFFVFACVGATIGYEILMILGSYFLEPVQSKIDFFPRMGEVLLTPLFSPVTYMLMKKLDQLTEQEEIWRLEV